LRAPFRAVLLEEYSGGMACTTTGLFAHDDCDTPGHAEAQRLQRRGWRQD
jgi:hypothetical protein